MFERDIINIKTIKLMHSETKNRKNSILKLKCL